MRAEDNIEVIFFPQDICASETMRSQWRWSGDYLVKENKMLLDRSIAKTEIMNSNEAFRR